MYSRGSNGNVFPTSTIIGPNTLLDMPNALTLDSSGNIYVADGGEYIDGVVYGGGITLYPPAAQEMSRRALLFTAPIQG